MRVIIRVIMTASGTGTVTGNASHGDCQCGSGMSLTASLRRITGSNSSHWQWHCCGRVSVLAVTGTMVWTWQVTVCAGRRAWWATGGTSDPCARRNHDRLEAVHYLSTQGIQQKYTSCACVEAVHRAGLAQRHRSCDMVSGVSELGPLPSAACPSSWCQDQQHS